jgi:uncharacterized membrane protein YtjA (UPF0391 family)
MSLLKWALIMLVVSLVAALFGFTGLAAASADVARILFYIFLVIFLVLLVLGLVGARAARGPWPPTCAAKSGNARRRQNENPARVWHSKREVARAGSRESSGGLGERGLHQAKHPARGKYSARGGRHAGIYFRYGCGFPAGLGFRSKPLLRLAQNF